MLAVIIAAVFFGVATQSEVRDNTIYIPGHDGNGVHVVPGNTAK